MIEIEIRGKISLKDFERLSRLFRQEGKLIRHYHRLSVDLSPGFDPKTRSWPKDDQLDLRIKKTDEEEKISVKVGNINAQEREEVEIRLKEGEFEDAVKMFTALGFKQGMIYFWQSWEYVYKKFEVKLTRYGEEYYSLEIESPEKNLDPNVLAKELNLDPFTDKEYKKEINWQNFNLHQIFSLKAVEKILKENF